MAAFWTASARATVHCSSSPASRFPLRSLPCASVSPLAMRHAASMISPRASCCRTAQRFNGGPWRRLARRPSLNRPLPVPALQAHHPPPGPFPGRVFAHAARSSASRRSQVPLQPGVSPRLPFVVGADAPSRNCLHRRLPPPPAPRRARSRRSCRCPLPSSGVTSRLQSGSTGPWVCSSFPGWTAPLRVGGSQALQPAKSP